MGRVRRESSIKSWSVVVLVAAMGGVLAHSPLIYLYAKPCGEVFCGMENIVYWLVLGVFTTLGGMWVSELVIKNNRLPKLSRSLIFICCSLASYGFMPWMYLSILVQGN